MTERTEYEYDIFISHSPSDSLWVWNDLLPQLEGAGLHVCISERDFTIGVPTLVNIERAVDRSQYTLIVLTQDWIEGVWTEFESLLVGTADPSGRKARLLPLLLRPCRPPTRISMLTLADLTRPEKQRSQIKRVIRQIVSASKIITNPIVPQAHFIVGPPIMHPSQFFGRQRELKRIFKLWQSRPMQNAAIIGPRRSGKTSLLQYVKNVNITPNNQLRYNQHVNWLEKPDLYRWVFIDFQDPRMGNQVNLLRYILSQLNMPVPEECNLDRFIDVVSGKLHNPTIICLDEMGVALSRYKELDDAFWEGLRALSSSQTNGNLGFILATHEPPEYIAGKSGYSSPFFNIFGYTTTLEPLIEQEARELIASSPISFSETDIKWILDKSGKWPILLNILCREHLNCLEERIDDDSWKDEGVRQMHSFRHLFAL